MSKTLNEIILESDPTSKNVLKRIIDKTIPSFVVEKRLDMLKERNTNNLISLLRVNHSFKMRLLSEVTLIEDILVTGISKTDFGKKNLRSVLDEEEIFPTNPESKCKEKFVIFIKKLIVKSKLDYHKFIETITFYKLFNESTLGGKLLIINFLDSRIVSKILVSNETKYTKKELIKTLTYSKKIRNYAVHNFFILNKGPYLKMVENNLGIKKDEDKLKFLFGTLDNILKIVNRENVLKRIKNQIIEEGIEMNNLDILLFDI